VADEKDFFPGITDTDTDLTGEANRDENMTLDLDGVDETKPDFEPLPPGIYNCEINDCEFRRSKAGNPMLSWQFTVLDGEFENRKLFYQTVLNKESGQKNLKRMLIRLFPDVDLLIFTRH
jgi:hypothetical protein